MTGVAAFILVAAAHAGRAVADTLASDNFSTFATGNLVGQGSYVQFGASATNPLQVTAGHIVIPGVALGTASDDQDAYRAFPSIAAPVGTGTTSSVFVGLRMRVNSAAATGSYFFAMTDTPTGFANERVTARDSSATTAGTYQIGGRVTGQAGFPFVYGTPLTYGTTYNVVLQAGLVDGAQNDFLRVFVNPTGNDPSALTPYAASTYTTGAGTDPTALAGIILSQFSNGTSGQTGVEFDEIRVATTLAEATVPEPASAGLAAAAAGLGLLGRRRRP